MHKACLIGDKAIHNMKAIGCAPNGIREVAKKFLHPQQEDPEISTPTELVQMLRKVKQKNELEDVVTCRYNTAALTHWMVEELKTLNPSVFQLDSSPFSVLLLLLSMMELSQLLRALALREIAENPELASTLKLLVEETRQRCKGFIRDIKSEECIAISENTKKSRDVLLMRRVEAVDKTEVLLSPLLQLDLHCVYSNILLNLRRMIRNIWQLREGEIRHRFRTLKVLEVLLYYLSVVTFTPAEATVRLMANDTLSPDRDTTFVYLIHDEDGLRKMSHYLQEAPLFIMDTEMDFLSSLINRRNA